MTSNPLVVEVFDAAGLQGLSELVSRGHALRYQLRDPAAVSGPAALTRHANRNADDLRVSAVTERLGMSLAIVEHGIEAFCFSDLRAGAMAMTLPGAAEPVVGAPGRGLIHGGESGLAGLTQDGTARTNLWVTRARMEAALAVALEEAPRERLRFEPVVDWTAPGPDAVRRLLLHAEAEFARPNGMSVQPVALAAFTDLFIQTALRELPHNRSERLRRPAGSATPGHLRRAEAFMQAQADAPIGLAEIAAASGCSVRTLHNAFRLFRGTTPHCALQRIRLECVRDALRRGEAPLPAVARRFGFSHLGRFAASYARQFGEKPPRG